MSVYINNDLKFIKKGLKSRVIRNKGSNINCRNELTSRVGHVFLPRMPIKIPEGSRMLSSKSGFSVLLVT